jgi:hypothetical protein
LLALERGFVRRVTLMERQRGFESLAEAGGGFVQRVLLMRPRAEATVHGAIAIEHERGEGQIVIKLEAGEVEGIGIDDAHAHKLIEQRDEFLFLKHRGIHARAGKAGHAAQNDEQRLLRRLRQFEAGFDVVVVPAGIRLKGRLVTAPSRLLRGP